MKDRLNINSVNLHHRFSTGGSELEMRSSITRGQDHWYFVTMEETYV